MSKKLFVVGAGASSEVGLPVGSQLVGSVARLLGIGFEVGSLVRGDPKIYEAMRHQEHGAFSFDHKRLLSAAREASASMSLATSIDRYIDDMHDAATSICGKLAISRAILAAEQGSGLYFHPQRGHMDWGRSQETWFRRLFHLIIDGGCKIADLPERLNDFAIVCFNYDRCIEHYLFNVT